MRIPMVNLAPALEATSPMWRANLKQMFAANQFISGQQLALFERELADALGARFAIGVGSGTAALELCLREAGPTGSVPEVITSPVTSPFTGLAILAAGFAPRFADVEPDSLLLDPGDVENRRTRNTAAVVPVHLYGSPCDLVRFAALAHKLKLDLIQDACQAHGATCAGKPLADYSPRVAYSFYPTKNLGGLGDGGAVLTNRASVDRRIRLLRDGGRKNDQVSRIPATNSRLDEIQCCFLRAFLPNLREWNARRSHLAAIYDEELAACEAVRTVRHAAGTVNHLYVIRVERRERLRAFLLHRGVVTGVHYPVPLHLQPAFTDCHAKRGDLPNAERACREIVSLPLWPYMPESAVRAVATHVRTFYMVARTAPRKQRC